MLSNFTAVEHILGSFIGGIATVYIDSSILFSCKTLCGGYERLQPMSVKHSILFQIAPLEDPPIHKITWDIKILWN